MIPEHQSAPTTSVAFAAFESPESAWRTLTSFAVYRMLFVIALAIIFWGVTKFSIIGGAYPFIAAVTLGSYLAASAMLIIATQLRMPSASIQLTAQILVDIVMIVFLMHASGGSRSGIGMLLIVSLAAGALVSQGRMAYFHAAVAALAVLFEQLWQVLYLDATVAEFVPSGMLSTGYFVIAGLGNTLAKYAKGAEQIAEKRGVDLANLAQINELVIRDMQDGFVVVDEMNIIRQHNPQSQMLIGGLVAATGQQLQIASPQLAQLLVEWRHDRTRIFPIVRDTLTKREYQPRFIAIGEAEVSPTVVFIEDASRIRAQAQQMKLVALGRLTASIAHEIRNPLSSINHAAELLNEDPSRTKADSRLLNIIHDNAHRLDRLVEEVLYLNRRDRAHPEPIDLNIFLTQFLQDFCANEKQQRSMFQLTGLSSERSIKALFDRAHLDQVLWNLVRNASRFATGDTNAIKIIINRTRQHVGINVYDDGPGVAADALPHLFEPFFTTDAKGTGLGLYIARELAEVNDATLEYIVDSSHYTQPAIAADIARCHFRLQMKSAPDNKNESEINA
jgi:two-component system sensor histidine kinase PilS (NtrC family)